MSATPEVGAVLTAESVKLLLPGDVLKFKGLTVRCLNRDYLGSGLIEWERCDDFGRDTGLNAPSSFTFVSRPSLEPPASDVAGWPTREAIHDTILTRLCGPFDLVSDENDAKVFEAADAIRAMIAAAPPHPASKEVGDE